jgi:hypothetical protein
MTLRSSGPVPAILALVGLLACGDRDHAAAARAASECDSTRVVSVALDSIDRVYRFKSSIHQFADDSSGFRVVTWPTPGQNVLDGMAIVLVNHDCRIVRLTPTDSA